MSRLIDADNLEEAIKEYFKKHITDNSCMVDGVDCSADICRFVKEQPTAFDVEKVLEQLEKSRGYISSQQHCDDMYGDSTCDGIDCFECCLDYLIKIVKRGGREC